jgi:uncharacterized protein
MLTNTFCHIKGIGIKTEEKIWGSGIHNWDMFHDAERIPLSKRKVEFILPLLEASAEHLENKNPYFFGQHLPVNQYWRLFPYFRDTIAYVDIETTGLENWCNEITTIALYDNQTVHTYINGQNLNDFVHDIQQFKIIVTYNGRCFDVPFINEYFQTTLDQVHIDLRYLLKGLGLYGGLKECERQMGIDRGDLKDIDGYYAVILWGEYKRTGNLKSLETLIEYNSLDAKNLETLMVMAYNMKLKGTPFYETNRID